MVVVFSVFKVVLSINAVQFGVRIAECLVGAAFLTASVSEPDLGRRGLARSRSR